MATINTIGTGNSINRVNRINMSKSRTMLRYSDRRTSDGAFVGVAQLVSRLALSELKLTNPFVIS